MFKRFLISCGLLMLASSQVLASTITWTVVARSAGVPTAGLTPTWSTLVKVSDGTAIANPNTAVPITALAGGGYKLSYDAEGANGPLFGIIDFGNTITDPNERYAEIYLTIDGSRIASNLDTTVSSRSNHTAAQVRQEMDANSTQLAAHTTALNTLTTRIPGTVQPQTGDAYARLGVPAGASISADIAANLAGINGVVSGVLNATAGNYNTAGSIGAKINAAGNAGPTNDPFTNSTSTAYGNGTFGALIKSYLDAAVSTRQASGVAVTLPSQAPTGYGGSGGLTNQNITDIVNGVLNATLDSGNGFTLRMKDAAFLTWLNSMGKFGNPVRSTSAPWTITVPFLRLDGTTTAWTYVTTYTDNTFTKVASPGRVFTAGSLPQ